MPPVNHNFPGMFEIHRDAITDHRLDLTRAPIGPAGMAHECAGFKELGHAGAAEE